MKSVSAWAMIVAGAALAVSPDTAYAQCVIFEKPEELFALSQAVFVGTVVAHEPTGAEGSHVMVDVATLRMEKSWKGPVEREIRVGSDVPFEVGKKYVVFAGGKPLSRRSSVAHPSLSAKPGENSSGSRHRGAERWTDRPLV